MGPLSAGATTRAWVVNSSLIWRTDGCVSDQARPRSCHQTLLTTATGIVMLSWQGPLLDGDLYIDNRLD